MTKTPLLLLAIMCVAVTATQNLAATPPMGWNSWNRFACNVSDSLIRSTADAMVESGMHAAGYEFVNIDDCWQVSRDGSGRVVADPERFPHGIKAVADYVHAKGLKLGIYTCAGTETCQGRPGSFQHAKIDAETYAAWGVDYVKEDWCFTAKHMEDPREQYTLMSNALAGTERPIVFSLCDWGVKEPWLWGRSIANMWRTTPDIRDSWDSMTANADATAGLFRYAGPGGWNDPDMLEVGNGGMTADEYRVHMSLWAILAAPLIAGNDIANMDAETRSILLNTEVIAVNQDVLGKAGTKVFAEHGVELWARPLADGSRAAAIVNRNPSVVKDVHIPLSSLGITHGGAFARDLWEGVEVGYVQSLAIGALSSHACVFLRVSPQHPQDRLWEVSMPDVLADESRVIREAGIRRLYNIMGDKIVHAALPLDIHRPVSGDFDSPAGVGRTEQLRLSSTGNAAEMVVQWVQASAPKHPSVSYSPSGSSGAPETVSASCTTYTADSYTSSYICTAKMTGLTPSAEYDYSVGDTVAGASSSSFVAAPAEGSKAPLLIAAVGDHGHTANSTTTLERMAEANASLVLHAGDISYANGYQPVWDTYGELIAPVSAKTPWMTVPGNHEHYYSFHPYATRYYFARDAYDSPSDALYYAFDYGPVHVIGLDSESSTSAWSEQHRWLSKHVDRIDHARTPWVIAMWHRPWYNSNGCHQGEGEQMRQDMEKLLYKAKTNLALLGHVHAYERTHPVMDNKLDKDGIVHMTIGNGGNHEGLCTGFIEPAPEYSANRGAFFGHIRIAVEGSEMRIQSIANDGSVFDDFTIPQRT